MIKQYEDKEYFLFRKEASDRYGQKFINYDGWDIEEDENDIEMYIYNKLKEKDQ
ncbi:MAG TPA: hypothetical protein VMY59_04860 [Candidatus Thermoplasmatota archaeon]|nr:hypothetical protein [Candidatus Thermoplasmatota archaeon]